MPSAHTGYACYPAEPWNKEEAVQFVDWYDENRIVVEVAKVHQMDYLLKRLKHIEGGKITFGPKRENQALVGIQTF